MSRSSYLYQAPHQGIGQASYNNRMAKERGEAQQRLQSRDNAYDFGPMQPERSALARMADQATMGQPVNLNEAERLQKAAIDRQLIEQGQRQKAIDEAVGRPSGSSSPAPRTVPGMSFKMKPEESSPFAPGAGYQATDPNDPYYSKTPRRPMRLAEGGLFSTPLPGYAMGGPVMRDYGMGGPGGRDYGMGGAGGRDYGMGGAGMRGYAMGGLVEPPLKGGLGQMMPNGQYLRPQKKPDFMINQGYAEGGPVEGPGGPKDDLINAKLSDGEFVMPAEVVEFYGLDRLHKMMAKAKEGLNEIKPAPQALPTPLPVTMPQPTPAFAYGGMATRDSLPGYKLGGQFDEEEKPTDAMDPLPQAIAAQQRAVEANQNPSFLDYYFPEAGVEASQAASSATQQTNDRLGSFFDSQNAMDQQSREAGLAQQKRIRDMELMNDPNWQQANPGLYKYQAEQLAQSMGPIAGPQRLTAVVGDQAYGPTMTDSPAFQPMMAPSPATPMMAPAVSPSPSPQLPFVADPATLAAMRSRRADLRAQPAPAPANGRQPAPVLSSPMDVPLMRPAPLTMTEKEQQAKPISRSRTPESNPEFEAALAGLTGMQKRRARAGLQMEEATFQRNQGRAAIDQANIDARDAAKQADADRRAAAATAAAQEWWKQQQQIGQNFDMARENRNINNAAALNAAEQARADQRALMEAEQKAQADAAARQITMQPIPGTPGYNVAMMGGSRVPGTPLMQAQTTPGPFREGLGRTTYTPIPEAPAPASPPTVRKSAPSPGATKEAPEWEYATMSDLSTRPITIENPRPDQMSDRFKHQYGKAPQTEADWTDAYYLTTGQPRPKTTATAAPAAGTAAPRAKIKAVTPVS